MNMRKQTQAERLLNYLRVNRTINPMTSWQVLGIYRLSAVVFKLRRLGWSIESRRKVVQNQFGEPCLVAEYALDVSMVSRFQ